MNKPALVFGGKSPEHEVSLSSAYNALKHIQKANAALGELTSDKMSHLGTGEAYVWSSKASDDSFTRGAVKIKCRPRITQHGGSTKTAVGR